MLDTTPRTIITPTTTNGHQGRELSSPDEASGGLLGSVVATAAGDASSVGDGDGLGGGLPTVTVNSNDPLTR